nr:piggyBac transposable element-derived protein 3-like [Misgurnus anguillicaudatus]
MAKANPPKERYTLAELLDILDTNNPSGNFCNVTVVPESEKKAHDTDCDSDGSDDDVACDYKRLPSRLLKGEGLISDDVFQLPLLDMGDVLECPAALVNASTEPNTINAVEEKENSPTTPGPMLKKIKNKERKFKKFKADTKKTIQAKRHQLPPYQPKLTNPITTSNDPADIFLTFYPKSLRDITLEMLNTYAAQKGATLNLTDEELLTFYGILLTTGYNSVPRQRLLWSGDNDVNNTSIKDAMRRNRFDEIMASIHVVDNMKITDDSFFKERPVFEELNKVTKTMTIQEYLAVDEMMIEYFGKMEPYAGSHTRLVETGLGQGPSVVLGLAEKAGVPPGCKFYHDNLFTTLTLVDEMTKRGYGSCGTLRENRLFDIPLTPSKIFRKTSRGNVEFLIEDGKLIVRWNDNSVVTVVTNMENKYSDVDTQRWNKQKHAMDKVKQPTCIKSYNTHMGGVDLHDDV